MFRSSVLLPVAALTGLAAAGLYPGLTPTNHTCVLGSSRLFPEIGFVRPADTHLVEDPVLSCSAGADPELVDTCCTETFGGLVVSCEPLRCLAEELRSRD